MKSLPKYLPRVFFMAMLLISVVCPGQKLSFGTKAGVIFSNATIRDANAGDPDTRVTGRTGITGGFFASMALGQKAIFRPGIEIVSKGVRNNYNSNGASYGVPFTYVDVPLNVLYKINFSKGHLLVGGGPYIGFSVKDFYPIYPVKTDAGLNALTAYETSIGFSFNLNYSYGLSNASNNTDLYSKIMNRYFGITVGYLF